MTESIQFNELAIPIQRKAIKHLRLRVQAPEGRISLSAPHRVPIREIRAFVASKGEWIRKQQARFRDRPQQCAPGFVSGETHWLWGRPLRLEVRESAEPQLRPGLSVDETAGLLWLHIPYGSDAASREALTHQWHRSLLHAAVPDLIREGESRLGVQVNRYYLQRMKTRWGSCNQRTRNIRLNTELVKRPREQLEYVVMHELAHLIQPNHSPAFYAILDRHHPGWREAHEALRNPASGSLPEALS